MRVFGYLLIALAFVCKVVAETVEEEEDVLVLTDANYVEVIESHDMLLVEFYAPWCGHCKSLAPEYAKAAGALKQLDPPIRIAKVDATVATGMAETFGISGFPTLKLFRKSAKKDDAAEYDGGRTSDEIQKWLVKKSGPAVRVVETPEDLETLKKENEVVVVAYLSALDGEDKAVLEQIAGTDDNNVYVVTANAAMAKEAGKTVPGVTLYKHFDEKLNEYDGAIEKEALTKFVQGNCRPLVMTFSQEKASMIFGGDIDKHLLMFSDEKADYHEGFVAAAKGAAQENRDRMLHIVIPLSEDRVLDYFGFTEADLPAIMLVNMEAGMKKFGFPTKASELKATIESTLGDDLLAFENSYFNGEMKPTLKSAEPEDDSDEAVKVIVGKEFKKRVIESKQDVLLEFYAPWCGHCKSLAPKYEELAESFSSVDSIMIAKMDATENEIDHPGVDVQGFPTLIFFPANDKENPRVYDGEREVAGFTEYLKKNAKSFELDGEKHGTDHDEL